MSDQESQENREDGGAEARLAADLLRRRLLKTGVAAVPVIISLQSGTAWAVSSVCASNINRPTKAQLEAAFSDFKGSGQATATQLANQQLVTSLTGLPDKAPGSGTNDIESIVKNFVGSSGGMKYPTGPGESVETGDMIHLIVTNGSCWTSYCNGPINGTHNVTIFSNTTPSVCK
jgi:hypothetical protein